MTDLKDAIKNKNLTVGTDITLKKLRNGEVKTIYLARNCPKETKETIQHYAKLSNVQVIDLDIDNDELGIRAKKPYSISVLAI